MTLTAVSATRDLLVMTVKSVSLFVVINDVARVLTCTF